MRDLEGLSIGIIEGYNYGPSLKKALKSLRESGRYQKIIDELLPQ